MRDFVNKVQIFLLCFTVFVFPLYIKATSISLILVAVFSFIPKQNRIAILSLFKDYRFYLFISPLIIALIGLIFTDSFSSGLQIVEVTISLFVFPIVFKTFSVNNFKRRYRWLNTWFIIGLLTAFIICIGTSSINYMQTGDKSYFYYTRLTHMIMLPNQLSIYVLWGMLLLLFDMTDKQKQLVSFNNLFVKIFILFILLIFLFLMASKAAFLIFCLSIIILIGLLIKRKKIPIWQSISIIVLLSVLSLYLFNHTNIKPRVQIAWNVITNNPTKQYGSANSTALRVAALHASFKLIKAHPITGVGTGDLKLSLIEQYNHDRVPSNYMLQTNPHNQFIYSTVMNGVAGFLSLFAVFIIMFVTAIRKKEHILLLWTCIMFLFFLSDDLLVIQVGVVFFAFYSSLLMWGKYIKIIEN